MKPPIFNRMFGYNTQLLPNPHLASLEEGVLSIETARKKTGATIGYPGWGLIYTLLLSHLDRSREEVLIETGTNWGCTTIILAQALKDSGCKGRVITIELDDDNLAIAKRNVAAAGLADYVVFENGDSREILPSLKLEPKSIRFAFLDASHLLEDVMAEFTAVLPRLTDDALVLFDNTYALAEEGEDQRVNGALKLFPDKFGGNLINLENVSWYTPGLAMWQKTPKL